jgi:predicted dienelactone hydrolase
MITLGDYFFRVLTRFGAIPLWLLLILGSLFALYILSRQGTRANVPSVLLLGVVVLLIVSALLVTPAAWRAGAGLAQVMRGVVSGSPPAAGPYSVTLATLELAPLQSSSAERQPILLQLWYPSEASGHQASPDRRPISCLQLREGLRLPQDDAVYSVVLFAPGLYGKAEHNRWLIRSLASHGYVVAAIDDVGLDSPRSTASPEEEEARLRPIDFSSAEAVEATMRRGSVRVAQEASKALEALDGLEACLRSDGPTYARMNFARVGFVGFSFGGAVAAESSIVDSRVAAVANLDGSFFGRPVEQPLDVPFMMLSSDFNPEMVFDPSSPRRHEFLLYQRDLRILQAQSTRPDTHLFLIRGAFHDTFLDPTFSPRSVFKQLLLDTHRAQSIIGDYVVGFLDAYLKGNRRALISPDDPRYPEVQTLDVPRLSASRN